MPTDTTIIRSKDDVVREVNETPRLGGRTRMIGTIALGGFFIDAYDFTSLSAGSVQLQQEFHLDAQTLGLVTAVMAFGAILGAFSGGYFVDRFGRLKMFMVNILLFVVATIGAALSPNYGTLVFFRLLIGIGVGLDVPVAMAFLAEFMAVKKKGKWVESAAAMWSAATIVGLLVALGMNHAGVGTELWRWAVGLGAVPAIVILALRFKYMSESPMWAANRGDLPEAARILSKMNNRPYSVDENAVLNIIEAKDSPGFFKVMKMLFAKQYRMRSILIVLISAAQSVQFSSVGFYLPLIVFSFISKSVDVSLTASIAANACGLVGALLAGSMVNRLGLRRLSIIGFGAVGVILLILGVWGQSLPALIGVALLALFIGFHTFGPGSTAQSFSALSYPTQIRGAGAGLSQAANRTGSLTALFLVPILLATLGLYGTLFALVIAPVVGLIALAIVKWEPIGKNTEEEVEESFVPMH
ncbi:MFS transporter [Arthrobacter sp. B2a2-09]|uniref:MFS transporter n=1 Tax=Arthrobacter sp. B2a2-09 TaxID=2952822 RepID=UPI0022CDB48C|nr:MFS transporter [Arthrobacter sp. B2a2-09]MCZ9883091.1 MFS transporter [Arthrobacter sp. B2a2-09]